MDEGQKMKSMIRAYFQQTGVYYSQTSEVMIPIKDMNSTYAANAADLMLREATRWATDAGVPTKRPNLWMVGTPLFKALVGQANRSMSTP